MTERAEEPSRAVADRQAHGDSLSDNSRTDTLRRLGSVGPELAGSATLSQQELVDRLCDDQVKRWRAGLAPEADAAVPAADRAKAAIPLRVTPRR